MKWFVALLALGNTGMYLWVTGLHKETSVNKYLSRPAVNAASMKLLNEPKNSDINVANAGRTQTPKADVSSTICLRVGPFAEQKPLVLASRQMEQLKLQYRSKTVKARKIRAYRVYLGPFTSGPELERQRKRLNTLGVDEHYVVHDSESESAISLGLFSQNITAEKFLQNLKSKNINAQTRAEMRTLDASYWLEVRDLGRRSQARNSIQGLRWSDPRTRVREYSCT